MKSVELNFDFSDGLYTSFANPSFTANLIEIIGQLVTNIWAVQRLQKQNKKQTKTKQQQQQQQERKKLSALFGYLKSVFASSSSPDLITSHK